MIRRGRILRKNNNIRDMISENQLSMKDMIQPLFIIDGKNKREKIDSMEGIERKTIDLQLKDIENLVSLGLRSEIGRAHV